MVLRAQPPNPAVQFDHITYLTPNLDSLTTNFIKRGFQVTAGERQTFGLQSNFIWFEDGTYLELQTTASPDSTDWRNRAERLLGTHISTLAFRTRSLDTVALSLLHKSIAIGPMWKTTLQCRDAKIECVISGTGLAGPAPLDMVFMESAAVSPPKALTNHTNHAFRVNWLLLTASADEEQLLRTVFDALGFRKRHEGCCDYWMIGPVENRMGLRFQLPQDTFKPLDNWLSIDDGAVIFSY